MLGLNGRSGRIVYGMIALPILLERQFHVAIIRQITRLFAHFIPNLADIGLWLLCPFLLLQLLIVPLVIVSVRRLHDIGLTGFLALPYFVSPLIGFYVSFIKLGLIAPDNAILLVMLWLRNGAYYYGLAMAAVLLLMPARKQPSNLEPASTF